jgi:hypothetical protein
MADKSAQRRINPSLHPVGFILFQVKESNEVKGAQKKQGVILGYILIK